MGIEYLHEDSLKPAIIHKDLKPENIVVSDHGSVKIIDFGISGIADFKNFVFQFKTTVVGKKAGTWLYAAPELFDEKEIPITVSYDIFSLGLIINQIFSKDPPVGFYFWNQVKLKFGILEYPIFLDITDLRGLIRKCIQKNYSERPNIKQIKEEFQSLSTNHHMILDTNVLNQEEKISRALNIEIAYKMTSGNHIFIFPIYKKFEIS